VVYGKDGLDEVSLEGPTMVGELIHGEIKEYEISPTDFGLKICPTSHFKVTSPQESMKIVLGVLNGEPGPAQDIVCLNAGAALYAADLAKNIGEGLAMAQAVIKNGQAKAKLDEFIATTKNLATSS
jgi:anthranilate phosphoribosyltransferase